MPLTSRHIELSPEESISYLQDKYPKGGLFADKKNLLSPEPFPLTKNQTKKLERLGKTFARFIKTCSLAYHQSHKGILPTPIHQFLDTGKPNWLTDLARSQGQKIKLPNVIRPDLLLTEKGFALTELDNVPGGIGLLAFLEQQYEKIGHPNLVGGAEGMIEGFQSIVPNGADLLVSEESGDYRPEMEWLTKQLGDKWIVHQAETYQPTLGSDRSIYRFFELFDHENVTLLEEQSESLANGSLQITPPPKPYLEEKLWLALFWLNPLQKWWERNLRKSNYDLLKSIIPPSWVVDPTPIPPHATLPRLDVNSWEQVAEFSQKQREFVLKLSGFSELAWGSRSVKIGHDLPSKDWSEAIKTATKDFQTNPWILQEYQHAKLVEHPYWNPKSNSIETMKGRVRLCPYYFVNWGENNEWEVKLSGVLATIVPAEKKLIHGMKDAILVPCVTV